MDKWTVTVTENNDIHGSYDGMNSSALLNNYGYLIFFRSVFVNKEGFMIQDPWVDFRLFGNVLYSTDIFEGPYYTRFSLTKKHHSFQFGIQMHDRCLVETPY